MEYFNNILAVEVSWLIDQGIISKSNYDNLVKRNHINIVRRGCRNTPALAAYDSMPERYRSKTSKRVGGDPYKQAQINQLEIRIEANINASEFFDNYKLTDGRSLPKETRREYYANAVVLDAIHTLINDKRAKHSALGHKASRAWEQISDAVQELDRSKYPHALPANFHRLEDRYKKYLKEGIESLIHKNFANKNAAKVDDDVKEAVLIQLLSDPRNLDNAQVMRYYNELAEKMSWAKITSATAAVWRDKNDVMIYARRRGETNYINKKTMHVKRSRPTCPLYFWTIDGWDAELMYQATVTDKKTGYTRITYHNRPTMVIVLDPCTNYPIGYSIGDKENPDLIKEALRNAIHHTKELWGEMYQVHQMQSDNYGRGAMKPYFKAMCDKYTPAQIHNAKAKVIEPWFKYFNKKHCQPEMNWSGFGVTSNKESQPNGDYLNKYRKEFPDYDGVVEMLVEKLEIERAAQLAEYLQKWAETPEEDKVILATERYLMNFGEVLAHSKTDKKTTVMIQDNGVKVTINGIKRDYDCFDVTFRDHYSTQWEIRFDPRDTTKVMAVNADETLQYLLEEKYVQPMALKDRKPGDSGELQRVRDFNKFQNDRNIEFYQKQNDDLAEIMPIMRQLDTLQKLMICDSHGQHKDRRNDGRRQTTPNPLKGDLKSRAVDVEIEDEEMDFRNLY